ncbi:MAG: hypothetical protein JSR45_16735 [Proteobacteria bacterium]|nr:hypothetical protein [Pseudomonadota bacterium]
MTQPDAPRESDAYGLAAFTLVTALLGRLEDAQVLKAGDKSTVARIAATMAGGSAQTASDPTTHKLAQHILAHLADAWDEKGG